MQILTGFPQHEHVLRPDLSDVRQSRSQPFIGISTANTRGTGPCLFEGWILLRQLPGLKLASPLRMIGATTHPHLMVGDAPGGPIPGLHVNLLRIIQKGSLAKMHIHTVPSPVVRERCDCGSLPLQPLGPAHFKDSIPRAAQDRMLAADGG